MKIIDFCLEFRLDYYKRHGKLPEYIELTQDQIDQLYYEMKDYLKYAPPKAEVYGSLEKIYGMKIKKTKTPKLIDTPPHPL